MVMGQSTVLTMQQSIALEVMAALEHWITITRTSSWTASAKCSSLLAGSKQECKSLLTVGSHTWRNLA